MLSGFSFQSARPPGPVRYYAVGYVSPEVQPGAGGADEADAELNAEMLAEELSAKCPLAGRPILEQAASGITVGPVDAIPVQIAVKMGSSPSPVNPKSQGVVPVAILGSASLDVQAINASSVRLGVGQALPRGASQIQDVNGDGVPDMMLQFATREAGIECGDTVLVISGKMTT